MNRKHFTEWIDQPDGLDRTSLPMLEQIANDFPWCQTAGLLYLINLRSCNDYRYDQQLRLTAALAADRSVMKQRIEALMIREVGETAVKSDVEKPSGRTIHNTSGSKTYLKDIDKRIQSGLEEIEEKKARLRDLIEAKKSALMGSETGMQEELKPEDLPARPLPKDELLQEFIDLQSGNMRERPGFFDPVESARKSISESMDIASETIARILVSQGNKSRAIKIYQQLMLKYPEKSSYFAAQIKKLGQG